MIDIVNSKNINIEDICPRIMANDSPIEQLVQNIMDEVRIKGDTAVLAYTKKFDGASLKSLIVTEDEIKNALKGFDKELYNTMLLAAENIREFHAKQIERDFIYNKDGGIVLGQKIMPLNRVGIYVPGGTAAYPSSVLMNAIPAKLAGVGYIAMASPPNANGEIPKGVLVAAHIAGVDSIYKMGGAQAVAAFAYGTDSVKRVDKIVGPGNAYVATAKRKVFGLVDIDMFAGPSEILIIADKNSNPAYVAADMLSQAEHDVQAAAILLTDSVSMANCVAKELENQLKALPRKDIAEKSLNDKGKIIICANLQEAVDISNQIAPEHLEIALDNPFDYLGAIKNAGSIFLGKNVPESLGDYFAGPNHTLPTSGTAKFSSPLGVYDFQKRSSFIYYSNQALEKVADQVASFAELEGLQAHAKSISIRKGNTNE